MREHFNLSTWICGWPWETLRFVLVICALFCIPHLKSWICLSLTNVYLCKTANVIGPQLCTRANRKNKELTLTIWTHLASLLNQRSVLLVTSLECLHLDGARYGKDRQTAKDEERQLPAVVEADDERRDHRSHWLHDDAEPDSSGLVGSMRTADSCKSTDIL